jgi:hypothetical protein
MNRLFQPVVALLLLSLAELLLPIEAVGNRLSNSRRLNSALETSEDALVTCDVIAPRKRAKDVFSFWHIVRSVIIIRC